MERQRKHDFLDPVPHAQPQNQYVDYHRRWVLIESCRTGRSAYYCYQALGPISKECMYNTLFSVLVKPRHFRFFSIDG